MMEWTTVLSVANTICSAVLILLGAVFTFFKYYSNIVPELQLS